MSDQNEVSTQSRFFSFVEKVNQHGWTGDFAVGAAAAILIGFPVFLFGPAKSVFGVSGWAVWGVAGFILGFFGSLSLYPSDDA